MTDPTARLLADPRYEVLPFMGFDGAIDDLPERATVAITASPEKGIELTVDRCVEVATETDLTVVPHVAARAVRDRDQLEEIVDRFTTAGIEDLFVPGGDNAEPEGEYASSYELLQDLEELDHEFEAIGITGYPEGHPIIDDETLSSALLDKQPYASYIVTQICFDPEAVIDWIAEIRQDGVELPVYVGVPGVMKTERMISISRKVGVGESIKFVRKTTGIFGMIKQLVGGKGRYRPDALVDGIAPFYDNESFNIDGVHLYTFNEVADCESWRQSRL